MPTSGSSNSTGDSLVRDIWGVTSIAIVGTILRLIAKFRLRQIQWDDALIVAAQVSRMEDPATSAR